MIPEQTRDALQRALNGESYVDPGDPAPSAVETDTREHEPCIERRTIEVGGVPDYRYTSSCSCGWNDPYIWIGEEGARHTWVLHLLTMCVPADWPEVAVEFVETEE